MPASTNCTHAVLAALERMRADNLAVTEVMADRGYSYKLTGPEACSPSASTPSPTSTPPNTAAKEPTKAPASSPEPRTARPCQSHSTPSNAPTGSQTAPP